MEWVTARATIECLHNGLATNPPAQAWVTIAGAPVLAEPDPQLWPTTCANAGTNIVRCALIQSVDTGYSDWLRIDGRRVALSTVAGFTTGTVAGTPQRYSVRDPGQRFVRADR
jgi:hypothetical protein